MIDEVYHPTTMCLPLVVLGAMLIEPTENQAKEDLDQYIGALRSLTAKARTGTAGEAFKERHSTPRATVSTRPWRCASRSCAGNPRTTPRRTIQ